MSNWRNQLKYDPLPALLSSEDDALKFHIKNVLLSEETGSITQLWRLPAAKKILKKQLPDGSWKYPGKHQNSTQNYSLVETWRQFRYLVDCFGFTQENPSTRHAAEYLFTCQTQDGDIRGFIANQYATYYTGAVLSLLIKAGYESDLRIEKGLNWLLSMRQNDGGWSIPVITHNFDQKTMVTLTSTNAEPVEPDRTKPFCHNATGMVIRAFAAHSGYRSSDAAKNAADLLKSRFFKPNYYTSYHAASHWVRFDFPFWWNNLVAALDSISQVDPIIDSQMEKAITWFIDNQQSDGLWNDTYIPGKNVNCAKRPWISLAICRIFNRLFPL
jgi:hypothetical protein